MKATVWDFGWALFLLIFLQYFYIFIPGLEFWLEGQRADLLQRAAREGGMILLEDLLGKLWFW